MTANKRNWIILTRLLMFLFLFSFSPVCYAKTTPQNWYRKELKKEDAVYKYKGKVYYGKDYKYRKIVDIDGDGTKELMLSNEKGSNLYEGKKMLLLTWSGKAKVLLAVKSDRGTYLYVNRKTKTFAVLRTGSDGSRTEVYRIKGSRIKEIKTLKYNNHSKSKYFIDRKGVSKEVFYETAEKFGLNGKAVYFK